MTNEEAVDLFEGWEPVAIEDEDVDFSKPIKGRYDVRVTAVEYKQVEFDGKKSDTIKIKMKVTDDISGDRSYNRFLDKTFWMGKSEKFADAKPGEVQLMDAICNTPFELPIITLKDLLNAKDFQGAANAIAAVLVEKTIRVKCYASPLKKQIVSIVKPKKEAKSGLSSLGF